MIRAKLARRLCLFYHRVRWRLLLWSRVTGRLKLRGDVSRIQIDRSFRCDGDLWLGVHADEGAIVIGPGVTASGPLVITAIRPLHIGEDVLFGPNVLITDHYHGNLRDPADRAMPPSQRPLHSPGAIVIGTGAQLGANCVVLSPSDIGSGAVIAANAVVKGIICARTIYTGLASVGLRNGPTVAMPEG